MTDKPTDQIVDEIMVDWPNLGRDKVEMAVVLSTVMHPRLEPTTLVTQCPLRQESSHHQNAGVFWVKPPETEDFWRPLWQLYYPAASVLISYKNQ